MRSPSAQGPDGLLVLSQFYSKPPVFFGQQSIASHRLVHFSMKKDFSIQSSLVHRLLL
jgi:hypothetical protein